MGTGRQHSRAVGGEGSGGNGGREPPRTGVEGDQQGPRESNRRKVSKEKMVARLLARSTTAGATGVGRGAASSRAAPWQARELACERGEAGPFRYEIGQDLGLDGSLPLYLEGKGLKFERPLCNSPGPLSVAENFFKGESGVHRNLTTI